MGRHVISRIRGIAAVAVLVAVIGGTPAEAGAMDAHTANPRFHCTAAVTKLGHRIRVTFRLRSENAHQAWHLRLWDNGVRFYSEDRWTNPQGRFVVVKWTRNRTGPDHVETRANALRTGKSCSVPVDI